jgi:hypothetical protein
MEYLITESQYDRVVFRFLNDKNLIIIEKSDEALFFTDSVDNEYSQIYFSQIDGKCFIRNKLINDVSYRYQLNRIDTERVIGRWVQKRINLFFKNQKTTDEPVKTKLVTKVGGVETIYSPDDFR